MKNETIEMSAMSAGVRMALILLVAIPLVIWVGLSIGDETLPIPAIIGVIVLGLGAYVVAARKIRLEAFLTALMIGGYIIGNRGFAQLAIIQGTPSYIGEICMGLCAITLLVRIPFTKGRLFPKDTFSPVIMLFLLMGTVHAIIEYPMYEMLALRDFAVVYYAFMFVVGYWIGTDEPSTQLIDTTLAFSLICLIPLFPLAETFYEFFESLAVRGSPLIVYKGDLVTTYYAIGVIFFYLRWQFRTNNRIVWLILTLLCLGMMGYTGKRAGLVAFGLALLLMIIAFRARVLIHMVLAIVLAALLYIPVLAFSETRFQDTGVYALIVSLETITDVSGTGKYDIDSAEGSAQNNRFRTVWWELVADETMEKAPVFGLGFGYDLAARFLRVYERPLGEDFDARSPHSYFFTILGRMGGLGVVSLLSILVLIAFRSLRVARMVRKGALPPEAMAYWLYAVVILGSAFFGVVLEGPMCGIPFWSFLGIAAGMEGRLRGYRRPERSQALVPILEMPQGAFGMAFTHSGTPTLPPKTLSRH